MNLAHPYNREDFTKFITDFLPDDFEQIEDLESSEETKEE